MNIMIEKVKKEVYELLNKDDSGHGMDHINRVLSLSLKFCKKEKADNDIVSLIALLHDVDDYKLFGTKASEELSNARRIMEDCGVKEEVKKQVIEELKRIGYSKSLKGIRPTTKEGMIVSDADMCDAIGCNGIIRTYKYSLKHDRPFFDKNMFPSLDLTFDQYTNRVSSTSVCHFFEKTLKLKNLMMTESGKEEALSRHKFMIDFLQQLFIEEDAPEWLDYMNYYFEKLDK